jgi:hypothetical protein
VCTPGRTGDSLAADGTRLGMRNGPPPGRERRTRNEDRHTVLGSESDTTRHDVPDRLRARERRSGSHQDAAIEWLEGYLEAQGEQLAFTTPTGWTSTATTATPTPPPPPAAIPRDPGRRRPSPPGVGTDPPPPRKRRRDRRTHRVGYLGVKKPLARTENPPPTSPVQVTKPPWFSSPFLLSNSTNVSVPLVNAK